MVKTIPSELIAHLKWNPSDKSPKPKSAPSKQEPTKKTEPVTPPLVIASGKFSIEDLVKHGKSFYNTDTNADKLNIGEAISLKEALEYATSDGVVASLPYLIAGKATADKKRYLWKDWFSALTEENVGPDKEGKFTRKGKPVLLVVHGGGILTVDRMLKAYDEGLTPQNAATYTNDEFNDLLEGKLPTGESIQIYTVADIKAGKISDPFGRYAVALDLAKAKERESGYLSKEDFMNSDLVLARAGTLEYLEKYFDKAVSGGTVGSWHKFNEIDPKQKQGRMLLLNNGSDGLGGYFDLGNDGRFVGVAPEAHRKKF